MAAGDIFNARLSVTSTRATLDALVGAGAKTYTYVCLRGAVGSVAIGNGSVTQADGFQLPQGATLNVQPTGGTVIGANLNLIGPGTVDFFGVTSA